MKKLFIFTLILLSTALSMAEASPFVEVGLTSDFTWNHDGHDDHRFKLGKCAGGGRKSTARGSVTERFAIRQEVRPSAQLSTGISLDGQLHARNTYKFETQSSQDGDVSKVSLRVSQSYDGSEVRVEKGHDCHVQYENGRPANATLKGQISFVYPLPKGAVFVRARRAKFTKNNVLLNADSLSGYTESLEQEQGFSKYNGWVHLWGPPDGQVRLTFDLRNVSGLRNTNEEYQVEFEPVYGDSLGPDQIISALREVAGTAQIDDLASPIFRFGLGLLSDLDLLSQRLDELSLNELSELGSNLLSNSTWDRNETMATKNWSVLRAILAQSAFEVLALKSLRYCGTRTVQDPFAIVGNQELQVSNLAFSQVMYSRAVWSAQFFDFSRFEKLFTEYQKLGQAGHTYSSVMANAQLLDATKTAARAMTVSVRQSKSSGYRDVVFYLQKLSGPSLREGAANFDSLLNAAKELYRMQSDLEAMVKDQNQRFRSRAARPIALNQELGLLRRAQAAHLQFLQAANENTELLIEDMQSLGMAKLHTANTEGLVKSIQSLLSPAVETPVEQERVKKRVVSFFSKLTVSQKEELSACLATN